MKQHKILTLIAALAIIGVSTTTVLQNAEAESLIPSWIKTNAACGLKIQLMMKLFLLELNIW